MFLILTCTSLPASFGRLNAHLHKLLQLINELVLQQLVQRLHLSKAYELKISYCLLKQRKVSSCQENVFYSWDPKLIKYIWYIEMVVEIIIEMEVYLLC